MSNKDNKICYHEKYLRVEDLKEIGFIAEDMPRKRIESKKCFDCNRDIKGLGLAGPFGEEQLKKIRSKFNVKGVDSTAGNSLVDCFSIAIGFICLVAFGLGVAAVFVKLFKLIITAIL